MIVVTAVAKSALKPGDLYADKIFRRTPTGNEIFVRHVDDVWLITECEDDGEAVPE